MLNACLAVESCSAGWHASKHVIKIRPAGSVLLGLDRTIEQVLVDTTLSLVTTLFIHYTNLLKSALLPGCYLKDILLPTRSFRLPPPREIRSYNLGVVNKLKF
jgi:hypothetical protein